MNATYRTGWLLSKLIAKSLFRFKVVYPERLIEEGGAILAMNHQSFLDPPLAGIACRKELYFLARKSLMYWPVVGRIFPKINVIPVDRDGADMSTLKSVIGLVKSGKRTIIFPEGTRTRDGALQPAKPGLGLIIAKSGAPVVPMRVFGAFDAFPRGAKGLKLRPITIVVGQAIHFAKPDLEGKGREHYQQLSERVMAAIAAIELPDEFSSRA